MKEKTKHLKQAAMTRHDILKKEEFRNKHNIVGENSGYHVKSTQIKVKREEVFSRVSLLHHPHMLSAINSICLD